MPLYTKESLDQLRGRVDLVDLISSYVPLKRSGATHKGLCPFHEEKTPSFQVQAGDDHYHCFGCGAHGDAIAFLMNQQKMGFIEAVEALAERFGVHLEKEKGDRQGPGVDRQGMKAALELACQFYHTYLLHTEEGHQALAYLASRGIDLPFIRAFRLGYAPAQRSAFHQVATGEGIAKELLIETGLLTAQGRDFFSERITFPIHDPMGAVIGFSARKIKEETFGGKYINTPETPLFKKSHVLYGLSHCRRTIAKKGQALIVEGQIDALRLIYAGIDYTVAAQGTAFGLDHVKILLDLGVKHVFLAMDGDLAGRSAAVKVGNFFQKKGVAVSVVQLPEGSDPDSFVKQEGKEKFLALMEKAITYLPFLVQEESKRFDLTVPAEKSRLMKQLTDQVRGWDEPVMVHESLRKIAQLMAVPESVVGVGGVGLAPGVKRFGVAGKVEVDPDRILETDLLRWLLLAPTERVQKIATLNVSQGLLRHPLCARIYAAFLEATERGEACDLMALGSVLEQEEEQKLLFEVVQKKVNLDKAEAGVIEVIHRLLLRMWMEEREAIRTKIQSGACSEDEVLFLAKQFDELKKKQPQVVLP